MLNIAICDDIPLHLDYSEKIIRKKLDAYSIDVDTFPSAEALLKSMSEGDYIPDIAVLDIELGDTDGIALAKELNRTAPRCRIIFLTSYIDYAPDVYFTDHTWFVIKSDIEKFIAPALESAIIALTNEIKSEPNLTVKIGGNVSLLPVSKVLYLELVDRKTHIVTENGITVSSRPPKELLANIHEDCIVRCHQSFHVNVSKIFSMSKSEFVLTDGSRIPISRTYKEEARKKFFSRIKHVTIDR